jgi:RNA polymerase sigma-B factor
VQVSEVVDGLQASHAYQPDTLSGEVTARMGRSEPGDPDRGLELAEKRMLLYPILARLDEREAAVVAMRFFDDMTQTQIGRRLGVSQMQVSRILSTVLTKLRNAAGATE